MLKHIVFMISMSVMLSCGQDEPLAGYVPKTPQEQALKSTLLAFQEGVNTKNSRKIENLIHKNAAVMTGRERKILSKAEYAEVLPKRLAENPPVALGIPKMTISGDEAEVKIYMTRGDYNGLVVFNMKRENDRWYIISWKY